MMLMLNRWIAWTLSLTLCATAVARAPAAAPALWGPPVMCHAIAFADGESLPFGDDRFDALDTVDRATVVDRAMAMIGASDDTFFHMETLRRGLVYVAWGDKPMPAQVQRLVMSLEARVEDARRALSTASKEGEPGARRALGLAAFDLAWTLEGLEESGNNPRSSRDRDKALELALEHRGDDAALQLGAAILGMAQHDEMAVYRHLDKALNGVKDETSLLARNADNTIGSMKGVRGLRALVALSNKHLERA